MAVASLWLFALLLVLWWLLSNHSTSPYFPPLRVILRRFGQLWLVADVGTGLLPSLLHLLIGYVIAAFLAVAVGALLWSLPLLREATSPVVYFLYVLPAPVLIPAALVLFGIGASLSVAIIAFACFWPILLNTVDGMRGTDPLKLDTARSLGLSFRRSLWTVVLPGASPQIVAGLRAGLQVGIILMVVSEEVGATNGIGYFILQAQQNFALTDMWTGILVLAIVGTVLNVLFVAGERIALRWYYGARAVSRER
ncbi:MAG TPA: ABC transporter permease subunit [Acidimicrobiales bacterium]|nr:ABC transporter permease subunit [Acidimicrobiales bacterium]